MEEAALEWVNKSWNIAFNPWNHPTLMKDEFFINSMVFLMDEQEERIIVKALEICYLLMQNRANHEALKRVNYVKDGLSVAYERYLKEEDGDHRLFLAKESLRKLKNVNYDMKIRHWLQLKDKDDEDLWGETVINFRIPQLTKSNKEQVHLTMAGVPGVKSVTSNVLKKYATVQVGGDFSTGLLRSTITARLLMTISTIHLHTTDWDFGGNLDADYADYETAGDPERELPSYFPDVDSPFKTKGTLTTADQIKSKASGIVTWLRDSFYW